MALARTESPTFATWRQAPPADPNKLRRLRKLRWEKAVGGTLMGAGLIFGGLAFTHDWHIFPLMNLLVAPSGIFVTWARFRRPHESVRNLMDVPPSIAQYPVAVNLQVNGTSYGFDNGVVSFVDGWLNFSGLRTHFSLDHSYCMASTNTLLPRTQGGPGSAAGTLSYSIEDRYFSVYFTPFASMKGVGKDLENRFRSAVNAWMNSEASEGSRCVFPPMSPENRFDPRLWRMKAAHYASVVGPVLLFAILALMVSAIFPELPGGSKIVVIVCATGLLLAGTRAIFLSNRQDANNLRSLIALTEIPSESLKVEAKMRPLKFAKKGNERVAELLERLD